jgi:predicted dehydrogenase
MSKPNQSTSSRREFLKTTGQVAAATTLTGLVIPKVHAATDDTLQVALIGCGGRGTGAAVNAIAVDQGPVKLVAMADVFEDRMKTSYENVKREAQNRNSPEVVDVPEERRFIGFDAYKQAMDCLKPGDIAIFATPLAFRWVHFDYAINKGLNVFMEKPLTADGPTSRRMLELGQKAQAKNLKVGVGLMSRHARHLQQLHEKIQEGALGDIATMYSYRMTGPVGSAFSKKWPGTETELAWQLRKFHSFIWASGGCFNDFYIHVIDHCCWMKNAWPVKAQAVGGRHYRNDCVDQNFDNYAVEYTFPDGSKLNCDGRCVPGVENIYKSYALGTKGRADVSSHGDCGPPSKIYSTLSPESEVAWQSKVPRNERNPYQNEWNDLVDAIRNDKPFNEIDYGVRASLTSSLGRKAAHTGLELTFDSLLNDEREYAPGVDKLTMDSPPPVASNADGLYPIPEPGMKGAEEY